MSKQILVVDNEPDVLNLVTSHLQSAGYAVSTATNGTSALHVARSVLPDLILLDLMMEDMDGFTVCEILRCQPSTAQIPVVMLTAMPGQLARLNGLASGAVDYLMKPISRESLLTRVGGIFEAPAVKRGADADEQGPPPLARLKLDSAA